MQLGAVRILVTDIARAKSFYTDYTESVGLPLAKDGSDNFFFIPKGGRAKLLIEGEDQNDGEGKALIGRFTCTSLRADNIPSLYSKLKAKGIIFTGKPEKQPWGGTLAHFQDPGGHIITLCGN